MNEWKQSEYENRCREIAMLKDKIYMMERGTARLLEYVGGLDEELDMSTSVACAWAFEIGQHQ